MCTVVHELCPWAHYSSELCQVICITVSLCASQIESKILPLPLVKTVAVIETSESASADIKKKKVAARGKTTQ